MEGQIASLRAELLHKEQENERVQLDLLKEREDREKAQKQVHICWFQGKPLHLGGGEGGMNFVTLLGQFRTPSGWNRYTAGVGVWMIWCTLYIASTACLRDKGT